MRLDESKFIALFNRQQESGLNVKDFCSNEGVTESTFYYWRKKLQGPAPSKGFIPLVVKPSQSIEKKYSKDHQPQPQTDDILLELVYPNGTTLRVKKDLDLSHLRALINLCD